jgi:hypothetical protein
MLETLVFGPHAAVQRKADAGSGTLNSLTVRAVRVPNV